MVAQPLHGLRPPLHVLLRPRVRGAGRPPADDRYGRSIRVKTNIAAVLRRELARPSWQRERVAIGAATDPYQPAEGRYRLTRACIVELAAAATPFSLITRGPMVWRDVDVLQDASRRAQVLVSMSVPTVDDDVWRTTEPGTAPPRQRLEAVRRLSEAGIEVSVGMAPILPGLSDRPDQLEEVVRAARAAGAHGIWANLLYLKPGTREHFLDALARDGPVSSSATSGCIGSRLSPGKITEPVRARVRELAQGSPGAANAQAGAAAGARTGATRTRDLAVSQRTLRRRRVALVRCAGGRRDLRADRGRPRGRA